jgi:transposase
MRRHRHSEFIRFLNAVERRVSAGKLIHAVLDNYATHNHPKVLAWLSHHPRWTFHFTPTSASWLNAVESFFSKMTRQRIRRGVFRSIERHQRLSRRARCQSKPSSGPNPPTPLSRNSIVSPYYLLDPLH